ncbi:MAG TPA: DUF2851 family protein [Crocinitomix sp.]|nr:DUF2851 family protein [Crocinitomix sp.]
MKEEYLHYIYKTKLLGKYFTTTKQQKVEILNFGYHNHNSGPDFLECKIKIDDKIWAGHIEFHVKASDWLKHNHQSDSNYNNVILHIVYQYDTDIKSGQYLLPTVEIKSLVNPNHYKKYQSYITSKHWIACKNDIHSVDDFIIYQQKEKALFNRLERKSDQLLKTINKYNGDRKKTFYIQLFKAFGTKVNQKAFLKMGELFDDKIISKLNKDKFKIQAYLFGLAGFLNQKIDDDFFNQLKNEFHYLKHLYNIKEMSLNEWKFSTIRPYNFPTIRLAQLSHLLVNNIDISISTRFDKLKKQLQIELSPYWKQHYNFNKKSKRVTPNLTTSFIDLLLINVFVPYLFTLGRLEDNEHIKMLTVEWLNNTKPEKNSIINQWKKMEIDIKNAFDSQALLEQKNEFCANHLCLNCKIGATLLKN